MRNEKIRFALLVLAVAGCISAPFCIRQCQEWRSEDKRLAELANIEADDEDEEYDETDDSLASVYDGDEYSDESVARAPAFVQRLFDSRKAAQDTLCQANGQWIFYANDERQGNTCVVYDAHHVILNDIGVTLFSTNHDDPNCTRFYAGTPAWSMIVDFSKPGDVARLEQTTQRLPDFEPFHRRYKGPHRNTSYRVECDVPTQAVAGAERIKAWLGQLFSPRAPLDYEGSMTGYQGNPQKLSRVAQFFAVEYFKSLQEEFGDNEDDYPITLMSHTGIKPVICNDRFISVEHASHNESGGAHGYYTECLLSYDHANGEEIDFDYLFKPGTLKQVERCLMKIAQQDYCIKQWYHETPSMETIEQKLKNQEGNDKEPENIMMPRPALARGGVSFSYQPYDIGCFAEGTYHFIVPYSMLLPYMTDKGRQCVALIGKQAHGK